MFQLGALHSVQHPSSDLACASLRLGHLLPQGEKGRACDLAANHQRQKSPPRWQCRVAHIGDDGVADGIQFAKDIVIPEPQHAKTPCLQISPPSLVISGVRVLATVNLDNQLGLQADEIRDVGADRNLPPELDPIEAAAA